MKKNLCGPMLEFIAVYVYLTEMMAKLEKHCYFTLNKVSAGFASEKALRFCKLSMSQEMFITVGVI